MENHKIVLFEFLYISFILWDLLESIIVCGLSVILGTTPNFVILKDNKKNYFIFKFILKKS